MFEITVAGRRNETGEIDVIMVEAGASPGGVRLVADGDAPSDEAAVMEGLAQAKAIIAESIDLQSKLAELVSIPAGDWPVVTDYSPEVMEKVEQSAGAGLQELIRMADRRERAAAERKLREETVAAVTGDNADLTAEAKKAFKAGPQVRHAPAGGQRERASGRTLTIRHPSSHHRSGDGGTDPRIGSFPKRRNAGVEHRHFGHVENGADAR